MKIFMTSPYNTRAQKQLVYSWKENRKRAKAARTNRVKPQSSLKPFEPYKHSTDTIMAPPKLAEPVHTTISEKETSGKRKDDKSRMTG